MIKQTIERERVQFDGSGFGESPHALDIQRPADVSFLMHVIFFLIFFYLFINRDPGYNQQQALEDVQVRLRDQISQLSQAMVLIMVSSKSIGALPGERERD